MGNYSKEYPVRSLCQVMKISKSAYYRYARGLSHKPKGVKVLLGKEVKAIFDRHKRRYGSRRIKEELKDKGIEIGIHQIRSLMKAQNLVAIQPKSFVPKTTQSHPSMRRSANLLLNKSNLPEGPNEVIVGDITYLSSIENGKKQWLYLAIWMDLFSRKIVGWEIDEHMDETLVIRPMKKLIRGRQPPKGLIVHTDGGGQYSSINFRALLASQHFNQSMTRKENHYDNAFAESLFSRIKSELEDNIFLGLEDAQLKIFEYIEAYYNTIRKHSAIGYLSPNQYENKYWAALEG